MNIAVISYSYTGNNGALADNVANELSAEHIKILEAKSRTTGSIILDMIFARTPKVEPAPDIMSQYDLILFFAPVWMGQAASPLRAYLKHLKAFPKRYGFLSISGGADGGNPKLAAELRKRTGAEPDILLDLHIADLLASNPKPERKDTTAYKINDSDIERLINLTVKEIRGIV